MQTATNLPLGLRGKAGGLRSSHCRAILLPLAVKYWAFLVVQTVKNLPATWETPAQFLGWEDSLAKGKMLAFMVQ